MKFQNETKTSDLMVFDNTDKIVDKESLKKDEQPVWVEHNIPNKTGNIVHFTGTGNAGMPFVIWFHGSSRKTNFQTIRSLAINGTIIWLDADDFDSNLSGKYYITSCKRDHDVKAQLLKCALTLKEYNN